MSSSLSRFKRESFENVSPQNGASKVSRAVLVAGGAGFIGSCFAHQRLATTDDIIITLDKLTYAGIRESLPPTSSRHHFVQGDIGDIDLVRELLERFRPEQIVNFAAESHVDRSIHGPRDFIDTNVLKTFDLMDTVLRWWMQLSEGSRKYFRFLQVSTDEVYGSAAEGVSFHENSPYDPSSPYSASKAASDHIARSLYRTYGFPSLLTNCSNNFGPRQFPEKLIPLMLLNALEGNRLPVYGDGCQIRDWLYVEDHCRALDVILAHGHVGDRYNISGNCERTNLEVVHLICDLLDTIVGPQNGSRRRTLIEFVDDRPGHDRRYSVDCSKLQRELGWTPMESLESALPKTIVWYTENQNWLDAASTRNALGNG